MMGKRRVAPLGLGSLVLLLIVLMAIGERQETSAQDPATPGVALSRLDASITEGESYAYYVSLATDPGDGATVTVTPTIGDTALATVSPGSLTFSGGASGTWATAQPVTLTTLADGNSEMDRVTITHAVSGYSGVTTAPDFDLYIGDAQANKGVVLSKPGLELQEGGSSDSLNIRFDTDPGTPLWKPRVHLWTSGDTSAVSANWSSRTITGGPTGNWAKGITFTATPQDHDDDSRSERIEVMAEGFYTATERKNAGFWIVVTDDEATTPEVKSNLRILSLQEGHDGRRSHSYTIDLNTDPGQDVTVNITNTGDQDGNFKDRLQISPTTHTFAADLWWKPLTVTVTAIADFTETQAVERRHTIEYAFSGYGSGTSFEHPVLVVHRTTPIKPTTPIRKPAGREFRITETGSGNAQEFTLRFRNMLDNFYYNGHRRFDVTLQRLDAADDDPATKASLVLPNFKYWPGARGNWHEEQAFTLTAISDADDDHERFKLSMQLHGAIWNNTVDIVIIDDDGPPLDIASASKNALSLTEDGGSDTFTVVLSSDPGAGKTYDFTIENPDPSAVTVSPTTLQFDTNNWSTPVTITVTPLMDDDVADETVALGLWGHNWQYGTVTVSIDDDEAAPPMLKDIRTWLGIAIADWDKASEKLWKRAEAAVLGLYPPDGLPALNAVEAENQAKNNRRLRDLQTNQRWIGHYQALASLWQRVADWLPPVINISGSASVAEGDSIDFTLTARPTPSAAVSVDVQLTQSGGVLTPSTQTVSIPKTGTYTLTVSTTDDTTIEPDGTVTATLVASSDHDLGASATATVVVTDDDAPPPPTTISIALAGGSSVTEGQTAEFRISATSSSATSSHLLVPVTVTERGGFVTAGTLNFVVPVNGSITFGLTTIDDAKKKSNGTVSVALQGGTGYSIGSPSSVQMTIVDNDTAPSSPVVSITAGGSVTEGDAATFTLTSTSTGPSTSHVNVTVVMTESGDYIDTGTFTLSAPSNGSTTFAFNTFDDSQSDSGGYITATLSSGSGYSLGASNTAVVVISDNDGGTLNIKPVVTIQGGDPVTEGTAATFAVTATPPPTSALTIPLTVTESGSFITGTKPTSVTIPNTGSVTFTVATTDDSEDESNGSVTATLTAGSGYTLGTASASVTVNDDDDPAPVTPVVSVNASPSSGDEGSNAVFWFHLTPKPLTDVTVNISVTQSGDFISGKPPTTVTIGPSGRTKLIVPTIDDNVNEPNGWVRAEPVAGTGYKQSFIRSATFIVNDDDAPTAANPEITIAASTSPITEGDSAEFTVTATPPPSAAISVKLTISGGGSFISGSAPTSVTIPNTGSVTLSIPTTDDNADEPNGSITATIALNSAFNYTIGSPKKATVAVNDDDDPQPDLPEMRIYTLLPSITEGGTARFTIASNSKPDAPITVNIAVTQFGDFIDGTPPTTVVVGTGGGEWVDIPTVDDNVDEASGSITVKILSGDGYNLSHAISATVPVHDNDPLVQQDPVVTLALVGDGTPIDEGGNVEFVLTMSPPPAADVNVNVSVTQSGDFIDGTPPTTVTIGSSGTATLTIATVDDNVDEANGWVRAEVLAGTGYTLASVISNQLAVNDDDPPVQQSQQQQAYEPPASLVSDLRGYIAETQRGTEHVERWKRVLIGLGVETYTGLTAMTSTEAQTYADKGWTRWDPVVTELKKAEAAPPPQQQQQQQQVDPGIDIQAGAGVTEGGSATFTVTATPPPASDLTVNVSVTESGSFLSGTPPTSVTITSSGTATLSFATANDATDEPNGSVTATLQSGRGYTLGTSSASVAVADDDPPPPPPTPTVSITAGADVTEGGGAVFTITANPAPSATLSVSVVVSQTGDFASVGPQTVTIPGTGSATLTIPTVNDSVDEPNGSLTVTLQANSAYTLGTSSASIAVADDDDPPIVNNDDDSDGPFVSISAYGGTTTRIGDTAYMIVRAQPSPQGALTVKLQVSQSASVLTDVALATSEVVIRNGMGLIQIDTAPTPGVNAGTFTVTLLPANGYRLSDTPSVTISASR